MVESTDLGWIQSAFDTLKGMFDQVELWMSVSQDRGDGVQALPGGRGAGRRILHSEDDRSRVEI